MVRLAAVLERLSVDKKITVGEWLLQRLKKASEPDQTWWAVGRVGTRMPFHGSIHNVVPKETATEWLERALECDWKKVKPIGFAATMIGRMTGDRERDIEPELRKQMLDRLRSIKAPAAWTDMVSQVTELDKADEQRMFGEALPPGLRLLD
jgi:hypothetical protein